jgi:hypothetical protein
MDHEEIQRILGPLKFGDAEQIRIKNLAAEGEGKGVDERLDGFLVDSLRRLGGCPPEAMARWAQHLGLDARREARRQVAALRELLLAMDLFLEKEDAGAGASGHGR